MAHKNDYTWIVFPSNIGTKQFGARVLLCNHKPLGFGCIEDNEKPSSRFYLPHSPCLYDFNNSATISTCTKKGGKLMFLVKNTYGLSAVIDPKVANFNWMDTLGGSSLERKKYPKKEKDEVEELMSKPLECIQAIIYIFGTDVNIPKVTTLSSSMI